MNLNSERIGEQTMKMTVTQALEERKLLVKQIFGMTERAEFVGIRKQKEDSAVGSWMENGKWKQTAEEYWQAITDGIQKYQKLDAAILAADATAQIETSFGTFSVLAALSIKKRLDGFDFDGVELEFEENLFRKVRREYREKEKQAEGDSGKMIDPLDILTRAEELIEKKNRFLAELTAQIQLSNARTWITME